MSDEKVDELTVVLSAIAAAKAASIAAVNALVAVEVMLTPPVPEEKIPDPHDDHGEKIIIETMGDRYILCPCGEQRKIPSEITHTSD